MKKRIAILSLTLAFLLCFTSCKSEKIPSTDASHIPSHSSSEPTETSAPETSSQTVLAPQTDSSDVSSSSKTETPSKTENSSANKTSSVVTSTESSQIDTGFTVNDPENTRGLSEIKFGFSYGVAKNGQPHSISVDNQKRFDGMKNIEALALDTVSKDKVMYLTFDCGYEYKNLTASILDTLKEKNVKAAFFCTLDYLEKNPQLVQRMIDEGHIVGNHSATHPVFPTISRNKMARELYLVHKYLQDKFGYTSKYFRFPTGAYSESALELVTSTGYKSVFWSLAHADWDTSKQPTPASALNTVTSRFHSGAVILLHAVSSANTEALGDIIDTANSQGYTFKTLDDYYNG